MPGTMKLQIITPERVVLERTVQSVQATGTEGHFEVLPGHEPLVATLAIDVMTFVNEDGEEHGAAVIGGLLEVRGDEVTVLSDVAELDVEIDTTRAAQAKERAEAEKSQRTDKTDVYVSQMAIGRAIARMKAAEMKNMRRKRTPR